MPHECEPDFGIDDLWLLNVPSGTGLWLPFLYCLVRNEGYKNIVELGCSRGESTGFLAKAAKLNGGHVRSFDYDAVCIEKASAHLSALGLLEYVSFQCSRTWDASGVADFLFADAQHTVEGLVNDWNAWGRHIAPNGTIVFHDMNIGNQDMLDWAKDTFSVNRWQRIHFPGNRGLLVVRNADCWCSWGNR